MLGWHALGRTVGVRALGATTTAHNGLAPSREGHRIRTRGCHNAVSLSLAFCLLMFVLTQPSFAGTYCGSDATLLGKLFKETSSDWWPDVLSYMDAITIGQIIKWWYRPECLYWPSFQSMFGIWTSLPGRGLLGP
jgi:hypothetical protein